MVASQTTGRDLYLSNVRQVFLVNCEFKTTSGTRVYLHNSATIQACDGLGERSACSHLLALKCSHLGETNGCSDKVADQGINCTNPKTGELL